MLVYNIFAIFFQIQKNLVVHAKRKFLANRILWAVLIIWIGLGIILVSGHAFRANRVRILVIRVFRVIRVISSTRVCPTKGAIHTNWEIQTQWIIPTNRTSHVIWTRIYNCGSSCCSRSGCSSCSKNKSFDLEKSNFANFSNPKKIFK